MTEPTTTAAAAAAAAPDVDRVDRVDRLLTEFTRTTDGVVHALVVAADGLRLAASPELSEVIADQLSAALSGLLSLARAAGTLTGALPVRQAILEMAGGYLFATAVGEGALLAVQTRPDADLGVIGYEMTVLVSRVGHVLTPVVRVPAAR